HQEDAQCDQENRHGKIQRPLVSAGSHEPCSDPATVMLDPGAERDQSLRESEIRADTANGQKDDRDRIQRVFADGKEPDDKKATDEIDELNDRLTRKKPGNRQSPSSQT